MTQCDRMLEVLRDGEWHTIGELFEHGIGRPNSRAAEIRARGIMVEHRFTGRGIPPSRAHQYRLIPAEENGQLLLGGVAA